MYLQDFFALIKPFHETTTTVYARPAFYPSLHFTHSLHFTPGLQSAVRSPQHAFYTDRIINCYRTLSIINFIN